MKKRRRRRLRFTVSQQKYMVIGGVMALLVAVALVSMLRGKTPAQFPFGHTYQVAQGGAETPIVYLTRDGHLLLESRDRTEFSDEGRLETAESGWTIAPRGAVTHRWNLWLEGESQAMLSRTEKGETVTWALSRVDNLTAAVGDESTLLPWFASGVYDSGSFDLPALTAAEGEAITFTADSAVDSLAVTAPDSETYTLTGDFTLPAQSGVYRIALDGGEYLLQVETE